MYSILTSGHGLLTNKYIKGIPDGSRASKAYSFLKPTDITKDKIEKIIKLNALAEKRKQSLAQMALAWLLKDQRVTSMLVGASSVEQFEDTLKTINN
jgi:L-glyceraldehyde 3-phosphate reductase